MTSKIIALDANIEQVQVIDHYTVNQAKVFITSTGKYLIKEPHLEQNEFQIYEKIMDHLMNSLPFLDKLETEEERIHHLEKYIWQDAQEKGIVNQVAQFYDRLKYYIVREVLGYGVFDVLMNDDDIEEILIERHDTDVGVIHRKHSEMHILDTNIVIGKSSLMDSYTQRLVQKTGKSVTVAKPIMDGTTRTKHRIMVIYGKEVSGNGSTVSIRKFPSKPYTITHLLQFGTISRLMAAYVWMLIDAKAFGVIVGETGSGKTTLINSLMTMANPRWRIITIEETPELQIPQKRTVSLHTRSSPLVKSDNDIGIMELIKATLRMRPDFVIVGEVRGKEANEMFQSAATGHGGLCLPADEPLLAILDEQVRYVTIKELVEAVKTGKPSSVISFDQITNSVDFFPVTNAFVKKGSNEFLEIRLNHGKIIRVHCGHPLLVLKDGELKTIPSHDAKIGDLIPVPTKLPLRETQKDLNLIKLMKNATTYERLYVSGANDRLIETLDKKVEPQLIWEWKRYRNHRNKKTMGISIKYFDMALASPDSSMTITCGQKGRDHIPAVLPLDYDLGYVLGWYIADGTISRSSRVVFYPGYNKNEARKISHALNRLGIKCIIRQRRIKENILWSVVVDSTIFACMISLLGCGNDAYTKRVPDIAFNASPKFREGIIVGYWGGDGHLRKHGKKSFMAKASTVSRDLVSSLHLLLKTLEIDSSVGMFRLAHYAIIEGRKIQTRDSYELRILAGPGKIKFRKFFERLSGLDNQITKDTDTCVVYEPIKNIIPLQIDSDLYDIEVAKTSNFLHGTAAFTHNSSVHGSDIKSALTRLAAEPINIKLSQQMLLWFAIHSTTLKGIDGKTMRRIKTLTEINPIDAGIETTDLFSFDRKNNDFGLNSVEELVKKSKRLGYVAELFGIDPVTDIQKRMTLLDACIEKKAYEVSDVFNILRQYYQFYPTVNN